MYNEQFKLLKILSVAVKLNILNGVIKKVKIALGAVAPTVIRASLAENYLKDKLLNKNVIAGAIELIKKESKAIDDIRSNSGYRNDMTGVLFGRGFAMILDQL